MRIVLEVDDDTGEVRVSHLTQGVSHQEFRQTIRDIYRRLDELGTAEQNDIDTLTSAIAQQGATLQQVSSDAQTTQANVQAELNNLEAQIQANQPPPNLDALRAAVQANADALAPLDGVVQGIGALTPQPQQPPAPAGP